jgi:DNA repair protein RecO
MSRSFSSEAIVIDQKTSGEKDIYLTLLTPKYGKIRCHALGASSIRSKNRNSLQLGNILSVQISTRNSYFYLNESVNLESFLLNPKKLILFSLLFYVLEIVKETIPENDPSEKAYGLVKKLIQSLNQNQLKTFIQNQLSLLDHLGFGTPDISGPLASAHYSQAQKILIAHFESILQKPLVSHKLLSQQ